MGPRRRHLRRRQARTTAAFSRRGIRRSKCASCCPTSTSARRAGLTIAGGSGKWLLGFTSLVDNLGLGSSVLVGVRPPGASRMIGTQRVRLANGKTRVYEGVAEFRYTNSPPHHHWHLMRFDSFELRTLDGRTLVRDRKSGFCLADHWGAAPGFYPGRHPVFLGDCEQFHPEATRGDDGHVAGLHRSLPGVLPRPERRHHERSGRASTTSRTASTRECGCGSSGTTTTRRRCGSG